MSNPVDPQLVRFAADLQEAYQKVCDDSKYSDDFFRIFEPTIKLFTNGEVAALFWEEGIEFHPKEAR